MLQMFLVHEPYTKEWLLTLGTCARGTVVVLCVCLSVCHSLSVTSLKTRPLPPQRLVLSGQTHGGRVWEEPETAYTVLDPCTKILVGQSDCRM